MNCDNCKNSDICKFEKEAREFETAIGNLPHPEVSTAFVNCKKFRPKMDANIVKQKIIKEIKDDKSVPDIAKEFNISETKVRYIKKSLEN